MQRLLTLLLVLLLGIVGCAAPFEPEPAAAAVQQSDVTRAAPQVASADSAAVVAGNSAFALDLYRQLATREGNLFLSPYSISLALAMTYAGARGDTAAAMADALHFTLPPEQLHPALNALDQSLTAQAAGEAFELTVANALWGQDGFAFTPAFLDLLAANYGAGMRIVDYRADAEAAREAINAWVSDQTNAKIPQLIPAGTLNADTRLVLTNAIYFNGKWVLPFDPAWTNDEPFYRLDGSTRDVPMMRQTGFFSYAAGDGYQAIALPYDDSQMQLVLILPDADRFAAVEAALTTATFDLSAVGTTEVALGMPRFTIEDEFSLADALKALGMEAAFGGSADFSGMTDDGGLAISDVIHKAIVEVDEAGTEAAAATGVIVGVTAVAEPPLPLTFDRPFIFAIRDAASGTLLFTGRYVDPGN